jgi:tetratricopeptide (TPR) repeat protein
VRADSIASLNRRVTIATVLLVCLLVAIAHAPLRHSEYIQDDHLAVEENLIVERGDILEIFSTSYWEGAEGNDRTLYRPVAILSFALERMLTGEPNALASQVVNVLLHLATSLTLLLLIRRLGADGFASSAAVLLFCIHPIHVEAVGGIVGRAEILAALFSFLALWLISHTGASSPGKGRLASWSAALCLFAALGSKEVALATPLLLVGMVLLFRPRERGGDGSWWVGRAAVLAPALLAALIFIALRIRALEFLFSLQETHPADNPLVLMSGAERAATALGLLARYAKLLFFPVGLSADYSGPVIEAEGALFALRPVIGTLILLGCLALLLNPAGRRGRNGRAPLWSFAALLFLAPYLIIGNLLFNVGTVFAERLAYLPSAGFCLMMGLLLSGFARRTMSGSAGGSFRLALIALAALVAGFTVSTWARCLDWHNDETLFTSAMTAQPHSPRAHYIVGKLHGDRGDDAAAVRLLERTIELYPAHTAAWSEMGVIRGRRGEFERASESFREVLRIAPENGTAHLNLGIAMHSLGRLHEAERSLRKAVMWDPLEAKGWAELGNIRLELGKPSQAAEAYRRAISLGRRDVIERLRLAESRAMDSG